MLQKIISGRWLTASAVVGFYPAASVGDDIELYADAACTQVAMTWWGLRQQTARETEDDGSTLPSRCLADFVRPKHWLDASNSEADSPRLVRADGQKDAKTAHAAVANVCGDYVGAFAVTAGLGAQAKEAEFQAQLDDYGAILFKALADRLAEALAECLHHKVRTDLWGYAPQENASVEDLIAERYQGIRPAPGYPACPDHSVKTDLFALLQCAEIGMSLTENLAMQPAASVCGFYLAHPQSRYFNVGRIGSDQLQDLAQRRGMDVAQLQRLLAPNL